VAQHRIMATSSGRDFVSSVSSARRGRQRARNSSWRGEVPAFRRGLLPPRVAGISPGHDDQLQ
jgi:hypothetical protein